MRRITYGASGGWYYNEVRPGSDVSSQLLSLFTGFNQAFFMGLFLLAGYFTPGAVERHGAAIYMRERAVRLGLPLIVYFLLLSPVTIALAATARGRPASSRRSSATGRMGAWSRAPCGSVRRS